MWSPDADTSDSLYTWGRWVTLGAAALIFAAVGKMSELANLRLFLAAPKEPKVLAASLGATGVGLLLVVLSWRGARARLVEKIIVVAWSFPAALLAAEVLLRGMGWLRNSRIGSGSYLLALLTLLVLWLTRDREDEDEPPDIPIP
jgi:hypothetical protein